MSQIKTVKDASDIVSVIGSRIELQRAGSSLKANCPFHGEKSPSFFVNEVMQRYKCFGCGESGDVINFLEKYDGMTFAEALQTLADQAGIKLEQFVKSDKDQDREKLLEILDLTRQYYVYLLAEHEAGQVGRDYLKQRGTNSESIKLFQLGYSLDKWDGLVNYLHKKKKYSLDLIERAGLIIGKGGRYYDRFRGRLMFPLKNHRGQVVGFSGRVLVKDVKEAKYINSPETELYHKSEMLFGFSELYQDIRKTKEVVVCEGEFDVLSSAQAHVNNVVAVKGSVLTEEHVKLISRAAGKVILALDRDSAGIEATKRAITIAKGSGLELRVANLEGVSGDSSELKDPDDIARSDPKAWREAVKSSVSVYEFLLQVAIKKFDPESPEGKREIIDDLANVFSQIHHSVEKDFYVKKLAAILGVKKELVEDDLKKTILAKKKGVVRRDVAPPPEEYPGYTETKPKKVSTLEKIEKYLLFLLLNLKIQQLKDKALEIVNFTFSVNEINLFLRIVVDSKKVSLKDIMADLPDDIKVNISDIYLNPKYLKHIEDLNVAEEWDTILKRYKKEMVKSEIKKITKELDELAKKNKVSDEDEMKQLELLQKIVELKRK
ncbi:MAG: DNA primase [Candidatus Pacebacteria bacterium]|nr:DNA primase [Candidatus Paceibacterota bacterium]